MNLLKSPPAISTCLQTLLADIATFVNGLEAPVTPSFGTGFGLGGNILFNCHYAAHTGDATYYDQALELLQEALSRLDPRAYVPSFATNYYKELVELGTLLCYLTQQGHLDWNGEALLTRLDGLLDSRLNHYIERRNLEIIGGALGIGFYFLRRSPHSEQAHRGLHRLLDAIQAQKGGNSETGYYWTCLLIEEPRVYTGISHGSAMIMTFLAALHEANFRVAECAELLHYATRFLLRTRMDPDRFISSFPIWQGNEEPTSNLCLIYGDLGTVHAILKAAQLLNNTEYLVEATAIALRTVVRTTPAESFVRDASVWYGASGVYLLYDRIYRQTGVTAFAQAAEYWLGRIPTFGKEPAGCLGFNPVFFQKQVAAQFGFNFGLLGIGLTLIHALSAGRYRLDEFIWLA